MQNFQREDEYLQHLWEYSNVISEVEVCKDQPMEIPANPWCTVLSIIQSKGSRNRSGAMLQLCRTPGRKRKPVRLNAICLNTTDSVGVEIFHQVNAFLRDFSRSHNNGLSTESKAERKSTYYATPKKVFWHSCLRCGISLRVVIRSICEEWFHFVPVDGSSRFAVQQIRN